jgi:hypothetical protein
MGVYHFMGLGRSPGAVTAAISYLSARYQRYDARDSEFFGGSGELAQQDKRGDVQALIFFTTPEVIRGEETPECGLSLDYVDNLAGRVRGGLHQDRERMGPLLGGVLPGELRGVCGGRREVGLYWCQIDRTDPYLTFERAARVMHATKPPGEIGKEIWINLTGGTNVVNIALQLAAALLGRPARLYYLLSEDARCLRHTTPPTDLGAERDRFWVEIPAIYLGLDASAASLLEVLEQAPQPLADDELLSSLKSHPTQWGAFQSMDLQAFRHSYLLPMRGNHLVVQVDEHVVAVGGGWRTLKRYYEIVADLRRPGSAAESSLGALLSNRDWFHRDAIHL